MMPSSDWKTAPVSLRIGSHALDCPVERGDVDLAHLHHRVERGLGLCRIPVGHELGQTLGRDLPRETKAVLAPAAHALLTAVGDDCIPVAVGFLLVVGCDLAADGF